MSAYLKNKPINQYMHKLMLDLCEKHQIEVPVLTLFNEVYYQCVRIQYDGNPYCDVRKRYLVEERVWLKSEEAAELVFCMVWALYNRKIKRNNGEEFLIKNIGFAVYDSKFFSHALEFVRYMEEHDLQPYRVFLSKPIPVKKIPKRIDLEYHTSMTLKEKVFYFFSLPVESSAKDFNPWRNVTDNYSEKAIKFYVTLYEDRQSQLDLFDRIKNACTKEELKAHKESFERLEDYIRWGGYIISSGDYVPALVADEIIMSGNLNCGYGSNTEQIYDTVGEYEQFVSQAMANNAAQLFDELDKEQLNNPRIRSLIGKLLAANTYCSRKVFISYASGDTDAYPLIDFLKRTMLHVEIDDATGQVTTGAQVESRPMLVPCSFEEPKNKEDENTVTVETKEGKTIYIIQNLSIYLTAEVVHQLNVNPQEVINQYHELIKAEVEKMVKNRNK